MSRFESSRFLLSNQAFNPVVLKQACDKLGWKYKVNYGEFLVLNVNQKAELYGEFALKIAGDTIVYNSYYLRNGQELIKELQQEFYPMNVSYSKQSVVQEFERNGFTLKRDWDFVKTTEISEHFYMVGETRKEDEETKRYEIEFSILADGTIVTDSNYLPDDVNDRAHLAMDELELLLGNQRVMTKKEIPVEYRNRVKSRSEEINKLKNSRL
jgi:hypothetical protein